MLKRRKMYRAPVTFATILTISAVIAFIMHKVDGAIFLGIVVLTVGLGMPLIYFTTFFASLKKSVKAQNLNPPRLVYSLTFNSENPKVSIENGKEKAEYKWKDMFYAFRAKDAIYLFITVDRAFILPNESLPEGPDKAWEIVVKQLGREKTKVL